MYGSGSLRPAGSNSLQQQDKQPNLLSHNSTRKRPQSSLPYSGIPLVPVSIPIHDFEHIPRGYPPYISEGILSPHRGLTTNGASNRGGLYGGRPEYANGRPSHGLRVRFPFDHGFIPGRGYTVQGINPGHGKVHYGKPPFRGYPSHGTGYMKIPEEEEDQMDDEDDEEYEHPCGGKCSFDEFLCITSCTCIKNEHR